MSWDYEGSTIEVDDDGMFTSPDLDGQRFPTLQDVKSALAAAKQQALDLNINLPLLRSDNRKVVARRFHAGQGKLLTDPATDVAHLQLYYPAEAVRAALERRLVLEDEIKATTRTLQQWWLGSGVGVGPAQTVEWQATVTQDFKRRYAQMTKLGGG